MIGDSHTQTILTKPAHTFVKLIGVEGMYETSGMVEAPALVGSTKLSDLLWLQNHYTTIAAVIQRVVFEGLSTATWHANGESHARVVFRQYRPAMCRARN